MTPTKFLEGNLKKYQTMIGYRTSFNLCVICLAFLSSKRYTQVKKNTRKRTKSRI